MAEAFGYSGTARRKRRQQTNQTYCHRATPRLYQELLVAGNKIPHCNEPHGRLSAGVTCFPAQFSAAVNQCETVASGQTREKSGIESPIDHMEIDLYQLKLGLIAFWTLWFAIVCLTNLFAGLKVLGIVPKQTKFASQNFALVTRAVSTYRPPPWLPGLLFCGVILWQFLAALLFARAFLASLTAHALVWSPVNTAFATGIALWAAFMIADEIFVEYNNERSHIMLFAAQLITLVGLHLLPA